MGIPPSPSHSPKKNSRTNHQKNIRKKQSSTPRGESTSTNGSSSKVLAADPGKLADLYGIKDLRDADDGDDVSGADSRKPSVYLSLGRSYGGLTSSWKNKQKEKKQSTRSVSSARARRHRHRKSNLDDSTVRLLLFHFFKKLILNATDNNETTLTTHTHKHTHTHKTNV